MNMFSLKALIDDILLIVRNNNISESEDLSRAQIAAWILAYRQAIIKQKREQENNAIEDSGDNTSLSELTETVGPLKLQNVESHDKNALFRRRTVDKIPEIIEADGKVCRTHILSNEEYIVALEAKLNEEVAEYQADKNLEEMADLQIKYSQNTWSKL